MLEAALALVQRGSTSTTGKPACSATGCWSATCASASSAPTASWRAGRRAAPSASSSSIVPTKFDPGRGHEHADPFTCPSCGAAQHAGDRFCEQCGARLDDEPGADATRVELDLVLAAAVSDQGLVHHRNEDVVPSRGLRRARTWPWSCATGSPRPAPATSPRGTPPGRRRRPGAGRRGSRQGRGARRSSRRSRRRGRRGSGRVDDAGQARRPVVHARLSGVPGRRDHGRLGRRQPRLLVRWRGSRQLTVDDSFAEEGIAKGLLTPEQAAKSPFLHSITHWVGPDAPERPPRVVSLRPERPGRLVLCTDGLWNYAPSASELGD